MIVALNEVEATAKRAARGAGYAWGLAEEASKATRWLCQQAQDGCGALAGLLEATQGTDIAARTPDVTSEPWTATTDALCPLVSGTALSDRASRLQSGDIRLGPVLHPLLLLPFAALAARQTGLVVTVEGEDFVAVTDGIRLGLSGQVGALSGSAVVRAGGTVGQPVALAVRAYPSDADYATLGRFAHLTFAPATEESRLSGAGAGLLDND